MGEGSQHLGAQGASELRAPAADELSEQDPEALRRDIGSTRDDMGQTLDEIEDRVRPRRIMERRTARMSQRLRRARDTVMGTSQDAGQRASGASGSAGASIRDAAGGMRETTQQAAGAVEQTPEAALERTRGNPLGAGLVAFGAGVLAAGLLPDTRTERRATAAVTEQMEPVTERLGEAASEVGHDVAGSASESARRTAEHARDEAQEAAHEVRQKGGAG